MKPMPSPKGTNYEGLHLPSHQVHAAYDAASDDGPADKSALMDESGSPIADSSQAHRILTACIDRLSKSDMDKVCGMMNEADLLSDDEVREISAGMRSGEGGSNGGETSNDAATSARRHSMDLSQFPHANRLK